MNWKSLITFGKYKDKTFLQLSIQHKDYLQWCVKEKLHETNEEIKWIWDNLKPREKEAIITFVHSSRFESEMPEWDHG